MRVNESLLQIVCTAFFLYHVEQRLRAEPSGLGRSNGLVCEGGIVVVDLDRLMTPATRRCVCRQLRLTALFETDEPKNGGLDGSANGQQAMVLEERSLLVTQARCDISALFFCQDNSVEALIEHVILWSHRQSF